MRNFIIVLLIFSSCSHRNIFSQEDLSCTFGSKQLTIALTALESRNLISMDFDEISLLYPKTEMYEEYFKKEIINIRGRKILISKPSRKTTHLALSGPKKNEKHQVTLKFVINEFGGKETNGFITYECSGDQLIFKKINFISSIE